MSGSVERNGSVKSSETDYTAGMRGAFEYQGLRIAGINALRSVLHSRL